MESTNNVTKITIIQNKYEISFDWKGTMNANQSKTFINFLCKKLHKRYMKQSLMIRESINGIEDDEIIERKTLLVKKLFPCLNKGKLKIKIGEKFIMLPTVADETIIINGKLKNQMEIDFNPKHFNDFKSSLNIIMGNIEVAELFPTEKQEQEIAKLEKSFKKLAKMPYRKFDINSIYVNN